MIAGPGAVCRRWVRGLLPGGPGVGCACTALGHRRRHGARGTGGGGVEVRRRNVILGKLFKYTEKKNDRKNPKPKFDVCITKIYHVFTKHLR